MPEIPQAAIDAAVAAYAREGYCDGDPIDGDERVIRAALEAAAPLLAEAVAQKILAHMEEHVADPAKVRLTRVGETSNRAARRHFRTAAQIASLAFTTREDHLRMAAEAIERGQFIACDIPEVPGDRT